MSQKPQSSAPFSLANPLICDQPLDRSIVVSPGPVDLAGAMRAEMERINANEIPPIAERIGQEGGASKIGADPRPRLFGASVVSTGGLKSPGDPLIESGLSVRKLDRSSGGSGEGNTR